MSHGIEVFNSGHAFATRSLKAWHGLGTVFPADADMSVADMLRLSGLADWNVRLVPAPSVLDDGTVVRGSDGKQYVLRTNPTDGGTDRLAIVGGVYDPHQNEETMALAGAITGNGVRCETMGSLDSGRRVFGSFAFMEDIVIDPSGIADKISRYLSIASSHDGTLPTTAMLGGTRVVCANTLTFGLQNASAMFKVRHTAKGLAGLEATAREVLGLADVYHRSLAKYATALYQTPITNGGFTDLVQRLYPEPKSESKAAMTRWQNLTDLLDAIYHGQADGPDTNSMIAGTYWGALNALTERIDWYRKPRGGDWSNNLAASVGFVPAVQNDKDRIWQTVVSAASEVRPALFV